MTTTTRQISGHELCLTSGRRYVATRPMACRPRQRFDVSIFDITDHFNTFDRTPVKVIPGLTYDAANAILNQFNDGETSFEGRIW